MASSCNTRGRCDSRHAPSRTHPRSAGPPTMQRSTSIQAAARSAARPWAGQGLGGRACSMQHKRVQAQSVCRYATADTWACACGGGTHTRDHSCTAGLSRQAGRPPKAARARPPQPRQAAELPREGHNRAGASPCTSLSPAKEVDAHCGWPTLCAETWRPMSARPTPTHASASAPPWGGRLAVWTRRHRCLSPPPAYAWHSEGHRLPWARTADDHEARDRRVGGGRLADGVAAAALLRAKVNPPGWLRSSATSCSRAAGGCRPEPGSHGKLSVVPAARLSPSPSFHAPMLQEL